MLAMFSGLAVGDDYYGQLDVSAWTEIAQITAGHYHTAGLKSNGTVVAIGKNNNGQADIEAWTDIIQVSAGADHTVGLKSDGTVVAVGLNNYHRTIRISFPHYENKKLSKATKLKRRFRLDSLFH